MQIGNNVFSISKLIGTETITANSAGTDRAVGERKVVGISIDAKAFVKFSRDGTNAAATDTLLPTAGIYYFHTAMNTVVSVFAHSGSNVICSVFECAN